MATDYTNSPGQRTTSPAGFFAAVTPASSALPNGICRGVYIGGAGNLVIVDRAGTTLTFTSLAVGVIHPIQAAQITAASTATLIIACY